MKKIILVVGRSASGKSSITREACNKLHLNLVKSYTTRPARPKELTGGSDHYFITEEEYETQKDQFNIVAYTEINGFKYFTTEDILNNSDVYVIDPKGIEYLKQHCSNNYQFVTVYIRTSPMAAKARAMSRGDDTSVFKNRTESEDAMFKKFEKEMPWQYHILNDGTFEEAVQKMERILRTELYIKE